MDSVGPPSKNCVDYYFGVYYWLFGTASSPAILSVEFTGFGMAGNQIQKGAVLLTVFTDKILTIVANACLIALILTPLGLSSALEGKKPLSGIKPLDENRQMQISPQDRCPVCGMKVIQYPKFNCAIRLKNTLTYYFCSTGCMIRSWMNPEIYLGMEKNMLDLPVVQEYFSGSHMDARNIIFVHGSDVIGPMGPALVPVKDENYLKVFKNRHGGKTQILLETLNHARWYEISGKKEAE